MEIDYKTDPTMPEAMEALARMEAEEADQPVSAPKPEDSPASANPAPTAPEQQSDPQAQPTNSPDPKPGAPATDENKERDEKGRFTAKEPEKQSAYAKNQVRLEGGWKKLNDEKAELQKAREALKADQDSFTKVRADFEAQRQQAAKPKYTPDQYEEFGRLCLKQAEELEAANKFEEADKKRFTAEQANAYAKQLRDNPPPTPKTDPQKEEEFKALQKEWWGKAAVDFPNTVKEGAPEKEALAALVKSIPEMLNDPKAIYYGARLVTAETAAARVPKLDSEIVALRAKVKELSEKLSPGGESVAVKVQGTKPVAEMSDEELEAGLRQDAMAMDSANGQNW